MGVLETSIVSLIGMILGGFLNLAATRSAYLAHLTLSRPLPKCKSIYPWLHLLVPIVPVVASTTAKRCGDLKPEIRGLLLQIVIAICCVLTVSRYGLTSTSAILIVYSAILVLIGFLDLQYNLIPNRLIFPSALLVLGFYPFSPLGTEWPVEQAYLRALAGAGVGLAVMFPVHLLSKGSLGAGDVKLCGLLGAAMGVPYVMVGVSLGILCGGAGAITLLLLRKRTLQDSMPYGPAMIVGAWMVICQYPLPVIEF